MTKRTKGAGVSKKKKVSAKAKGGGVKGKKRGRKRKEKVVPEFVEGLPPKGVSAVRISLSEMDLEDDTYRFRVSMRTGDLVKSISKNGQQFPVLLRGKKPPYQIVSGFRRIAAIQEIGWDRVSAIIRNDLSDEEAFQISFIENEMRKSLSDIDRANAVVKLKKMGKKSTEDVAKLYALTSRQVQRLQSIVDFPKQLLNAMNDGRISTTNALILHSSYKSKPDVDLKSWTKRIQEEGLTVEKLSRALKKEIKQPRKKKIIFEKRGKGFRMFPFAFKPETAIEKDKKEMIAALEKALDLLRNR